MNVLEQALCDDPTCVLEWALDARPALEPLERVLQSELTRIVHAPAAELLAGIDRILLSATPSEGLDYLQRAGVFAVIAPEVDRLVGFHLDFPAHHKDLWDHTLTVIDKMAADVDLRWAALLHDVGKIVTRDQAPNGKVTFFRHEAMGAFLARGITARLSMPEARAKRIVFVVALHGRVNAYEPSWSDRAVRRLARETQEGLDDLIAFSSADWTTKHSARGRKILRQLEHLKHRVAELERPRTTLPRGFGGALASALGLEPGPDIGRAVAWVVDEIDAGRLAKDVNPAASAAAFRAAFPDHSASR